jgi:hypothetical protein
MTEAGNLGEDEPHPMAALTPATQLVSGTFVSTVAILSIDKALKIVATRIPSAHAFDVPAGADNQPSRRLAGSA